MQHGESTKATVSRMDRTVRRPTASRTQIRALLAGVLVRDGYAVERSSPRVEVVERARIEDPDPPEWRE
jgi:hypothetical protein